MKVLYFVFIALICVIKNIKLKSRTNIYDLDKNFNNLSSFAENLLNDKNCIINLKFSCI